MYVLKLYKGLAINSRPSQLKAGYGLVIIMIMMMVMVIMIMMMKKTATLSSTSSGFSTRSS